MEDPVLFEFLHSIKNSAVDNTSSLELLTEPKKDFVISSNNYISNIMIGSQRVFYLLEILYNTEIFQITINILNTGSLYRLI